jgi:hypothetical protein
VLANISNINLIGFQISIFYTTFYIRISKALKRKPTFLGVGDLLLDYEKKIKKYQ